MSVSIQNYCETYNNELSHLLRLLVESGVFYNQDNLTIGKTDSGHKVLIKILYGLSCFDFRYLDHYSGKRYWGIRPHVGEDGSYYEFFMLLLKTDL